MQTFLGGGGVAILVRQELSKCVNMVSVCNDNLILCSSISKKKYGKHILIGSVYVPPENSK